MKYLLFTSFFLVMAGPLMARDRQLMTEQPVLSQLMGNCYTHAGTDLFTGIYLKTFGGNKVIAPDPLLLGGIAGAESGRVNISSGVTCNFFNDAKKAAPKVCSSEAFARYVTAHGRGMTSDSLKNHVKKLDSAMKNLSLLFKDSTWTAEDRDNALKASRDIIEATCSLGGVVDVNNKALTTLLDDARLIISKLSPDKKKGLRLPSFSEAWKFVREEFMNVTLAGVGPYIFRRQNDTLRSLDLYLNFDKHRKETVNNLLDELYNDINDRCLKFAKRKKLPQVPANYFTPAARFTCETDHFKKPMLSLKEVKPKLDRIAYQVSNGVATPIGVCSAGFYARSRTLDGYRDKNGECKNGEPHAVTVTGVKTINGKRYFTVRNSWGQGSCGSLIRGRTICKRSNTRRASLCPGADRIDCKDGVYTMEESYLGKILFQVSNMKWVGAL